MNARGVTPTPDEYRIRRHIEWTEPVYADAPIPPETIRRRVGEQTMTAEVEIVLQVGAAARLMGRKACGAKSRKCVDGLLRVHAIRGPVVKQGRPLDDPA